MTGELTTDDVTAELAKRAKQAEKARAAKPRAKKVARELTTEQLERILEERQRAAKKDYVGGISRSILKGASLGWSDEILAGALALQGYFGHDIPYERAYEATLEHIRSKDRDFAEAHPGTALGTEILGGMMLPGMAAKTLYSNRALSTGQKLGAASGLGGVAGGVAAAGAADPDPSAPILESAGERLAEAPLGVVVGSTAALAAPAVAAGGRKLAQAVTPNTAAQQGERKVAEALAFDDTNAMEAGVKNAEMPEGSVLADASGPNMRSQVAAIGNTPGPAQSAVQGHLLDRRLGRIDRIIAKANEIPALGKYADVLSGLNSIRMNKASPLYEAAKASPTLVNVGPIYSALKGRASLSKGKMRTALQNALKTFEVTGPTDGRATDLSIAGLHETKLAIDALIEGQGSQAISRSAKRELVELQHKLLDVLDEASPEYAKARQIWSSTWELQEALEAGLALFKKGKIGIESASALEKMTQTQKDFFKVGVAAAVEDIVENSTAGTNTIARMIGTRTLERRLRAVFDDPAEFEAFKKMLTDEGQMMGLEKLTLEGSRTTPMREAIESFVGPINAGVQGVRAASGSLEGIAYIGARILDKLNRFKNAPKENVAEEIRKIAANPNKEEVAARLMQMEAEVDRALATGELPAFLAATTGAVLPQTEAGQTAQGALLGVLGP